MKKTLILAVAGALTLGQLAAQTAASLQTYTGQVVSVQPEGSALMISDGSAQPTAYTYSRETQFVDGAGNVVSYESVRRDTPVRVEYVVDGDVRRVQRLVVQPTATVVQPAPVVPVQQTTVTTTTTTTEEVDD